MNAPAATAWFSLRRRLLLMLLGGLAACWAGMLAFIHLDAHREIDALLDAELAQAAQTLLALAQAEGGGIGQASPAAHKYQRALRFQIWHADGRLLLRSENAPDTPLTATDGFSEVSNAAGHWRYFSQWDAGRRLQVQVSEDHRVRDALLDTIAGRLLVPAAFGLPLFGLWIWVATRRSLSPLDSVAGQIAARDPQQLQALTPAAAPVEIRPMLDALNGLFQRVETALEAERRFTADAAHELRTPLAALQAQLQVALAARDEAERDRALGQLQAGLARAGHLVGQMLQLARLDPLSGLPDAIEVDLAELAETVCAELGPAILARDLEFELIAKPGVRVHGRADWLGVLLRNLVDNAVRYTPPGGRLRVEAAGGADGPLLRICDSGPGIPAGRRAEALQRFRRLDGAVEAAGSGLGLSIAARVAELHAARLTLGDSPLGGLEAAVLFPDMVKMRA